jgi:hypothetical protein
MEKKNHKILLSLTAGLMMLLLLQARSSFGQPAPKPLIRIGMSRSELRTSLTMFKKWFRTSEPRVLIEGYQLHGMRGDASFLFRNDTLILFMWQKLTKGSGLDSIKLAEYKEMIKGLQMDFGPGHSETSAYDPRIQLYSWRMPNASAQTSYGAGGLKFQMADKNWIAAEPPH